MNGGIRYTNLPNGRTQIPSSTKRFCIHAMSTGFFVSITPMAPSTRTSVTCGNRRAGSSSSCSCRLMRVTLLPVVFGRGQQLHRSARYGACQWIPHKGGSVHKHLRCMVGDGIRHFIRRQYGRQRHVSARYGLSYAHDVRFYTRVLPGKEFSRPSEARGYLIEYQQQAMFLAYLCRFAQVLGGGRTTCRQRPAPQVRG